MEVIVEGIVQSKTIRGHTITISIEVIRATKHVPRIMTIACDRTAYAAYIEHMRVHTNTYIITRITVEHDTTTSVQWIAIPAMTEQIQAIVSKHRNTNQLQHIANHNQTQPAITGTIQPTTPQQPSPAANTREQPAAPPPHTHEPEAITTRMKTSDIVLATLARHTTTLQQSATATKGYA